MPNFLSAVAVAFCFIPAACAEVQFEWANVGNPGNAPDTTGFGAVDYAYRISKHEVTNAQYAEFLNAVAARDTHRLYNSNMGSTGYGGISQSCSRTCTYSVRPNMGDKPVSFVSFWDAARFVNWMHNGQPTGRQTKRTTEDGAYTLGGSNESVIRNADATVFLPSEDEWYKAAYHKSDGVTGNYFDYPTSSDVEPSRAAANAVGDVSNPGINVANLAGGAQWNGLFLTVTTVGSATSTSPYGTFDQAGNVREWNEEVFGILRGARGIRGGGFASNLEQSSSTAVRRHSLARSEDIADLGFRVASIPEPCGYRLVVIGAVLVSFLRRGKRTRLGNPRCTRPSLAS